MPDANDYKWAGRIGAVGAAAIIAGATVTHFTSSSNPPQCGPDARRAAPHRPCDPVVGPPKIKDGSVIIYCKRLNKDITPYPCEIRPVKP